MRYVLDASVAICWAISRPGTPTALRLRNDFVRKANHLIAPSHFPGEVASALTKAERQKVIAVGDARPLIASVLRTPPALQPYDMLLDRAADISSQTRSGFYDCLYVALAERESCELVTDDDRLVRNLHGRYPFIVPLAALPWACGRWDLSGGSTRTFMDSLNVPVSLPRAAARDLGCARRFSRISCSA